MRAGSSLLAVIGIMELAPCHASCQHLASAAFYLKALEGAMGHGSQVEILFLISTVCWMQGWHAMWQRNGAACWCPAWQLVPRVVA